MSRILLAAALAGLAAPAFGQASIPVVPVVGYSGGCTRFSLASVSASAGQMTIVYDVIAGSGAARADLSLRLVSAAGVRSLRASTGVIPAGRGTLVVAVPAEPVASMTMSVLCNGTPRS